MKVSVYVDGSGGTNSGYGYFVKETGESFYEKKTDITNNQAEYMAIISALKKYVGSNDEVTIYSDSKNTVNQLNHEFAINNEQLRDLARQAWEIIGKFSNVSIVWIPRRDNLAGKMLGSSVLPKFKISLRNNFITQSLGFNLTWQNLYFYHQNQLQ